MPDIVKVVKNCATIFISISLEKIINAKMKCETQILTQDQTKFKGILGRPLLCWKLTNNKW